MNNKWLFVGGAAAVVGLGALWLYMAPPAKLKAPDAPEASQISKLQSSRAVVAEGNGQAQATARRLPLDQPLEQQGFKEIQRLAEQGNPAAQRVLSDRYADCSAYSLSPARYKANVEATAKIGGVPKPTIDRIKASVDALCAEVDNGQPIPLDAVNLWLEQSAKNGDLIAKVKLAARAPNELRPADANGLISDVVSSGDPNAILELSHLVGRLDDAGIDAKYARYVGGGPNDEFAWAIAACRKGASCGANSRIMKLVCINTMRCNYADYEQFLLTEMVPQGGRKRVDQVVDALERSFID